MIKKIYMFAAIGIVLVVLYELVLVEYHHVSMPWHDFFVFDTLFGFVGALLLMFFSLGLGEYFLWRPTCSVPLGEQHTGSGYNSAIVRSWLVELGGNVEEGQPVVELETDRGLRFTVDAPKPGRVSKCFFDPGDQVRLGETVVDLHVSKHAMHGHDKSEEGSHA